MGKLIQRILGVFFNCYNNEMCFCPHCKTPMMITNFAGEEKKDGKIIRCLECNQEFILKERK